MNSTDFRQLYTKQPSDLVLTPFDEETGFSLVREYPEGTAYKEDGRVMFIKVAILDRGLFYSVDMTIPEKEKIKEGHVRYILVDRPNYKKITNFVSNTGDKEFVFSEEKQRILHPSSKKELTLNEFVDTLVKNHMSDPLFWEKKLKKAAVFLLKTFFLLNDGRYNSFETEVEMYNIGRGQKNFEEDKESLDPFFKHFYVSKNMLLLLLCILTPLSFFLYSRWPFGDFSVSNPTVVFSFFLILFLFDRASATLRQNIKSFMESKKSSGRQRKNFIERLHAYQQKNSFNLKV